MKEPFAFYFGGMGNATWRSLALGEGVTHMALSFAEVYRTAKKDQWAVRDHFPENIKILLDSGMHGNGKSPEFDEDYIRAYLDFIERNVNDLRYILECDTGLSVEQKEEYRADFYDQLDPSVFLPVWHANEGSLEELARQYDQIAVPSNEIGRSEEMLRRLRVVGRDTHLFAVNVGSPTVLTVTPFLGASTLGWLSPMRFGETHFWIQNSFRRARAANKQSTRTRHAALIEKAGFDAKAVLADDSTEITRFTLWVWHEYEAWLQNEYARQGGRPLPSGLPLDDEEADSSGETVSGRREAGGMDEGGISPPPHLPPARRERQSFLPVFEVKAEEGGLRSGRTASLRECNSCYLAGKCDQYAAGSECAYELPVTIRTREEMAQAMQTVMEFQFQRLAFGYFAETKEGGFPDLRVSREMERYFRLLAFYNEFTDHRDKLSLRLEATSGGAPETGGILSKIFANRLGPAAAQPFNSLPVGGEEVILGEIMDIQADRKKKS